MTSDYPDILCLSNTCNWSLEFSWILTILIPWKCPRGGCWGEEEKYGLTPLQTRKIETWEDQLLYPSAAAHVAEVKREYSGSGYLHGHGNEEEAKASKAPWSQIMPASSPRSCITTSFSRNMLDFSNKQPGRMHHQPDNSSVVRSTCLIPCSCSILDISLTARAFLILVWFFVDLECVDLPAHFNDSSRVHRDGFNYTRLNML